MVITNVEDKESDLLIHIPDSKIHNPRIISVNQTSAAPGFNYLDIYRKYILLRSNIAKNQHLFLAYIHGKCVENCLNCNKNI